jgi:hypothetical protein
MTDNNTPSLPSPSWRIKVASPAHGTENHKIKRFLKSFKFVTHLLEILTPSPPGVDFRSPNQSRKWTKAFTFQKIQSINITYSGAVITQSRWFTANVSPSIRFNSAGLRYWRKPT